MRAGWEFRNQRVSTTRQYIADNRKLPQPTAFITCRADIADLLAAVDDWVKKAKPTDLCLAYADRLDKAAQTIRQVLG